MDDSIVIVRKGRNEKEHIICQREKESKYNEREREARSIRFLLYLLFIGGKKERGKKKEKIKQMEIIEISKRNKWKILILGIYFNRIKIKSSQIQQIIQF